MKKAASREVPHGYNIFTLVIIALAAVFGFFSANRLPGGEGGLWNWLCTFALFGFLAYLGFAIVGFAIYMLVIWLLDDIKGALLTALQVGLCIGLLVVSLYLPAMNRKAAPPLSPSESVRHALLMRLPSVGAISPEDYRKPRLLSTETKRWLIANDGWTKNDFDALDTLSEYVESFDFRSPSQDIAEGYVNGLATTLLLGPHTAGNIAKFRDTLREVPESFLKKIRERLSRLKEKR